MLILMVASGMNFALVRPVAAVTPRINEQNNDVVNADKQLDGANFLDSAGQNVELIGDVNDDGYPDYAISAPNNEDGGAGFGHKSGKVYIFFGGASGWSGVGSVDDADASYIGNGDHDQFGYRVSRLGDINNDGIDDFAISAPTNDGSGVSGGTTPTVDNTSHGFSESTDNVTFSHTFSGADNLLLVQAAYRNLDSDPFNDAITGMTYNGDSMTLVCRATNFGYTSELWYIVSPATGTNDVFASWSNVVEDANLAATSFANADTGTPIANSSCNGNGGVWDTTPNVTVTSTAGNLVYSGGMSYTGDFNSVSLDSGSEVFNIQNTTNALYFAATQSGAGSVTTNWTMTASWPWSTVSADLQAGGGSAYGGTQAGQVYIMYGKTSGWTTNATIGGEADASFVGENSGDEIGTEVVGIGDVNDDGVPDMAIGAYLLGSSSEGRAYVIYGHGGVWGFSNNVATSADLTYNGGFNSGSANALGRLMTSLGDLNGDTYADFAIAEEGYDATGSGSDEGKINIYFGSPSGPSLGASFYGDTNEDRIGYGISGVGDVNDDGFDDIAFSDTVGYTYLIFGTDSGWTTGMSPIAEAGATFTTISNGLAGLGDINGDGIDDMAIAGFHTHIFFGKTSGWGMDTDVSTADTYFLSSTYGVYGRGIAGGQDLNMDGYMDVIIGNQGANTTFGAAYIILGGPNKHSVLNLDAALDTETVTGDNVESGSGAYAANEGIRLKKGGLMIAQVTADLRSADRDWTGVDGDVNVGTAKSFVVGLSAVPGNAGVHSLFVPKSPAHNAVHICPSASSMVTVTTSCGGGYDLTTGDAGVSIVNIGGQNYWKVDGLTGTGGVGVALTSGDIGLTLTPNAMNTSTTAEIVVHWTPTANINSGGTAAIDFHTPLAIANTCAVPTIDADGDTTTDGSATITSVPSGPRYLYTFSASTTAATTTGLTFCVKVTSPSSAANYVVDAYDSAGGFASTFLYVGNENQLNIRASVDNVLTFTIRNSADTADLSNVGNLPYGPNLCDLGNLSTAGVQTCSYRLKVTTNAVNGYTVNILTDGSLRNSTNTRFISNITTGTSVTSGTEGYGLDLNAGSATGGIITPQGGFATPDTALATAVTTGINTAMYTCSSINNPASTDTTNTALVTHRAESDAGTSAGTYTQLVTYTVSASF